MKIKRTIVAVITAAAVVLSLTACGKNEQSAAGNAQNSGITSYDESNVRACNSTANMFVTVAKDYFADYLNNGGSASPTDGIAAEIIITSGTPSVKMNGYNDTAITDKIGSFEGFINEMLAFGEDSEGKAVIYVNKEGKPYAAVYSESMDAVFGTYSCTDDGKIVPSFAWRSENEPGVTADGHIVGTYPIVLGSGTALA